MGSLTCFFVKFTGDFRAKEACLVSQFFFFGRDFFGQKVGGS